MKSNRLISKQKRTVTIFNSKLCCIVDFSHQKFGLNVNTGEKPGELFVAHHIFFSPDWNKTTGLWVGSSSLYPGVEGGRNGKINPASSNRETEILINLRPLLGGSS